MGKEVKSSDSSEVVRWSVNRKKEVVLRLLRGESIDALSRELSIEAYHLEKWHRKALRFTGIDITRCPACGEHGMRTVEIINPARCNGPPETRLLQ